MTDRYQNIIKNGDWVKFSNDITKFPSYGKIITIGILDEKYNFVILDSPEYTHFIQREQGEIELVKNNNNKLTIYLLENF